MIKYGINDTKKIKQRQVKLTLAFTCFTDFQTFFVAQKDFGKNEITKNLLT